MPISTSNKRPLMFVLLGFSGCSSPWERLHRTPRMPYTARSAEVPHFGVNGLSSYAHDGLAKGLGQLRPDVNQTGQFGV
jgi:hypothetical protein